MWLMRKKASLDTFWRTLSEEQINGIQGIAMDMWDPFVNSAKNHLPDADQKIVFDKYHIAGYLGKAVDRVRQQERKDPNSDERLIGTKYLWLRNPGNFTDEAWKSFKALRESNA
jgi:transposase